MAGAATVLMAAGPAAAASPLQGKSFAIDVFQGPILAPSDIIGIERIEYSNVTEDLRTKLRRVLKQLGDGNAVQPDLGTE